MTKESWLDLPACRGLGVPDWTCRPAGVWESWLDLQTCRGLGVLTGPADLQGLGAWPTRH